MRVFRRYAVGYAAQWDEFYSFLQPLASSVPYVPAPLKDNGFRVLNIMRGVRQVYAVCGQP